MAKDSSPAGPATPAPALDRRAFLSMLSARAAAAVTLHSLEQTALGAKVKACMLRPQTARQRPVTAWDLRRDAVHLAFQRASPDHTCSGAISPRLSHHPQDLAAL